MQPQKQSTNNLQPASSSSNSIRPDAALGSGNPQYLTPINDHSGGTKRVNSIAGHMQQSSHTPVRDLSEPMLQGGPDTQAIAQDEGYDSADRSNNNEESSYLNNYSLKGATINHGHHVKIGLPLSNNDMHLNAREVAITSPTISRYSAANQPQYSQQPFYAQGGGAGPHYLQTPSYYNSHRAAPMLMLGFDQQPPPPQHHQLYERDNHGRDMLNLSQSQHSQTPTSFKMASPYNQHKLPARQRGDLFPRAEEKFEAETVTQEFRANLSNSGYEPKSAQRDQKHAKQRTMEVDQDSPQPKAPSIQELKKEKQQMQANYMRHRPDEDQSQTALAVEQERKKRHTSRKTEHQSAHQSSQRQETNTPQTTKQGTTLRGDDTIGKQSGELPLRVAPDGRQDVRDVPAMNTNRSTAKFPQELASAPDQEDQRGRSKKRTAQLVSRDDSSAEEDPHQRALRDHRGARQLSNSGQIYESRGNPDSFGGRILDKNHDQSSQQSVFDARKSHQLEKRPTMTTTHHNRKSGHTPQDYYHPQQHPQYPPQHFYPPGPYFQPRHDCMPVDPHLGQPPHGVYPVPHHVPLTPHFYRPPGPPHHPIMDHHMGAPVPHQGMFPPPMYPPGMHHPGAFHPAPDYNKSHPQHHRHSGEKSDHHYKRGGGHDRLEKDMAMVPQGHQHPSAASQMPPYHVYPGGMPYPPPGHPGPYQGHHPQYPPPHPMMMPPGMHPGMMHPHAYAHSQQMFHHPGHPPQQLSGCSDPHCYDCENIAKSAQQRSDSNKADDKSEASRRSSPTSNQVDEDSNDQQQQQALRRHNQSRHYHHRASGLQHHNQVRQSRDNNKPRQGGGMRRPAAEHGNGENGQRRGGVRQGTREDRSLARDDSFKSPGSSLTSSEHPLLSNTSCQYINPVLGHSRRDQKSSAKITARLNRTIQHQQDPSWLKKFPKQAMGGDPEASFQLGSMFPPYSPATRSHYEVLISNSNRKVAAQGAYHTDNNTGSKAKGSAFRTKEKAQAENNLKQEVVIGQAPYKRPNQTPQTLHEKAQQMSNQVKDKDFRATPSSLFGKKPKPGRPTAGGTKQNSAALQNLPNQPEEETKEKLPDSQQGAGKNLNAFRKDTVKNGGDYHRQNHELVGGENHEMSSASAGQLNEGQVQLTTSSKYKQKVITPNMPGKRPPNDHSYLRLVENPTAQLTSQKSSSQSMKAQETGGHLRVSSPGKPAGNAADIDEVKLPIDIKNMDSMTPSQSSMVQPASNERQSSSQHDCSPSATAFDKVLDKSPNEKKFNPANKQFGKLRNEDNDDEV